MGVTKGSFLTLLSIAALTCQAANTTFNWTSISHAPETSSTHGKIGDFVAIGLGFSLTSTPTTHAEVSHAAGLSVSIDEAPPTLASTASDKQTQASGYSSSSWTQSTATARSMTTDILGRSSGYIHSTTNITNATWTTDCWDSWLHYWSTSSLNRASYSTYSLYTTTVTDSRWEISETPIPTSSWESWVNTWTYTTLTTISSDGFPVSVSASYDTSTDSRVGWTVVTTWSSLGEFTSTSTETRTGEQWTTITQVPTALPTPKCELPAVVPECYMQWSSYIHAGEARYLIEDFDNPASGTFEGAPDCTQAMITGDECKSMASGYFRQETMYGHAADPGWISVNSTSYFPASKLIAPGCTLGCQACAITGESVQLYYWPPSTATLVEDGTGTATLTPFTQNVSSLRTVSVDGVILTSPTIYISYDILHASDSCGPVGKTYRNTILPLLDTNHLFSMETLKPAHGYMHGFQTLSFNLDDLNEPIPDSIYNRQLRCVTSAHDHWLTSRIYANASEFSCARTGPYAPIIGVPPEVRALDPAWESCGGWYGGLFDPPKALQPADAVATPTKPSDPTSPAATPHPTADSGSPAKTSAFATSSHKAGETQAQSAVGATHDSPSKESDTPVDNSGGVSATGKDEANSADGEPRTKESAYIQPTPSEGIAAIMSILLTQSNQASEVVPPPDPAPHGGHDVVVSAGSEFHVALSSQGRVDFDGTALTGGQAAINSGQTISVESGAILVNGFSQQGSSLERPAAPSIVFNVAGEEHTAVQQANNAVELDGKSYDPGAAATIDGSVITVASHGILAGGTEIPFKGPLAESLASGQHMNLAATSGANIVISGEQMAAFQDGLGVLIDNTRLTFGQVVTISGAPISVASNGIVIGSSMATFRRIDIPAGKASNVLNVDGTVYSASTVANQPAVVLVAGQTLSMGGPAATVNGHVITKGSDGLYILDEPASATMTSATDHSNSVVTIDGTAYTAIPIPGRSGTVMLGDRTLSVGGPGVTIADHLVTKGSNGISVVDSTSLAQNITSEPSLSTDIALAESSTLQQTPAASSEESTGPRLGHKSGTAVLSVVILVSACLNS